MSPPTQPNHRPLSLSRWTYIRLNISVSSRNLIVQA
eukprot:COSAG02_NODE_24101_length_697_cov_2.210702_1_plen_35_part_10